MGEFIQRRSDDEEPEVWNPEEEPSFEIDFEVQATIHNTIIRRFPQLDGECDYIMHASAPGEFLVRSLTPQLLEAMEELGFYVRQESQLDKIAIEHYVAMQKAGLDEELAALDL